MKSENFVAFFTVSGFFIGLSFSLLKSQELLDYFIYIFGITFFFYIFIHLVLTFFFTIEPIVKESFDKKECESLVNMQISQLKEKESIIKKLIDSIKNFKD